MTWKILQSHWSNYNSGTWHPSSLQMPPSLFWCAPGALGSNMFWNPWQLLKMISRIPPYQEVIRVHLDHDSGDMYVMYVFVISISNVYVHSTHIYKTYTYMQVLVRRDVCSPSTWSYKCLTSFVSITLTTALTKVQFTFGCSPFQQLWQVEVYRDPLLFMW